MSQALDLYDRLLSEDDGARSSGTSAGVCLHQAGDLAPAEESYRAAVERDATYSLAWNNLGVILAAPRRPDGAERAFREAVGLRPDFVDAWCQPGADVPASRPPGRRAAGLPRRAAPPCPTRRSPGAASAACSPR
jgi:tetratricopeptide (TPR) repeat protein